MKEQKYIMSNVTYQCKKCGDYLSIDFGEATRPSHSDTIFTIIYIEPCENCTAYFEDFKTELKGFIEKKRMGKNEATIK